MDMIAAARAEFVTTRVLKTGNNYGLFVCFDGGGSKIFSDITSDRDRLYAFSDAINRLRVSSVHIEELIEDFIG